MSGADLFNSRFPGFNIPAPLRLCGNCQKIEFECLSCPTAMEVVLMGHPLNKSAQADLVREKWAKLNSRASDSEISLGFYIGFLAQVREKSLFCNVCQLIWHVLCLRNGDTNPPLTWQGRDLECRAKIKPYGYFYMDKDCKEKQDIRRLTIEVGIIPRFEGDFTGDASYECNFALQASDDMGPDLGSICAQNGAQLTMDKMSFGGRVRPSKIDFRAIKWWLNLCENEHGCHLDDGISEGDVPTNLRMIDVRTQCVVPATSMQTHRYVALSYVWGTRLDITLTEKNIKLFTTPAAFQEIQLPQTIVDAIAVVQALGERYLWVDSLCIMQDQDEDKMPQIQCMDLIYARAVFTIVAASGEDAYAGLPGVRAADRSNQMGRQVMRPTTHSGPNGHVLDHHGMSLLTTLSPQKIEFDHYLEDTIWNTRGWTMQERVLSKRCLIFTRDQVHWECEGGSWCEESEFDFWSRRFYRYSREPTLLSPRVMMHPRLGHQAKIAELQSGPRPEQGGDVFWGHYTHLVMRFSRRQLTKEEDVLNAFTGIIRPLSRIRNTRFVWGHPEKHFSKMLMWSGYPSGRREALCAVPAEGSGGSRRVVFPSWSWMGWRGNVMLNFAFVTAPETVCFYRDETGMLRKFEEADDVKDIHGNVVSELDGECPWKPDKVAPVTEEDVSHEYPNLAEYPNNRTSDSILYFWASSAYFFLKWDNAGVSGVPVIYDKSSDNLGYTDQTTGERWHSEGFENKEFEFIVVGRFPMPGNQDGTELRVLQIEWKDGIAYRTNCGFISQKGWMAAERTWKLIALG